MDCAKVFQTITGQRVERLFYFAQSLYYFIGETTTDHRMLSIRTGGGGGKKWMEIDF